MTEDELVRIEDEGCGCPIAGVDCCARALVEEVRRLRAFEALIRTRGRKRCKVHVPGLGPKLVAYREATGLTIQVAATQAKLSIQTWHDAEQHSLASGVTIAKLSSIGVPHTDEATQKLHSGGNQNE